MMLFLASIGGFLLYVLIGWFIWSNKYDNGQTELTRNQWAYTQRQEWILTFIGSLLFYWNGEGIIDSLCDLIGYWFGPNAENVCTSIEVNLLEYIYLIGGATFGTILLLTVKAGLKYAKNRANKIADK